MKRDEPIIEDDLIRAKAHELWEQRGRTDGTPDEDWYRAEQLLRSDALGGGGAMVEPAPDSHRRSTATPTATAAAETGRTKKPRARRR